MVYHLTKDDTKFLYHQFQQNYFQLLNFIFNLLQEHFHLFQVCYQIYLPDSAFLV